MLLLCPLVPSLSLYSKYSSARDSLYFQKMKFELNFEYRRAQKSELNSNSVFTEACLSELNLNLNYYYKDDVLVHILIYHFHNDNGLLDHYTKYNLNLNYSYVNYLN